MIVTFSVPLPCIEAEIPAGHVISLLLTITELHRLEPHNALTSVVQLPDVAPVVPPTNV